MLDDLHQIPVRKMKETVNRVIDNFSAHQIIFLQKYSNPYEKKKKALLKSNFEMINITCRIALVGEPVKRANNFLIYSFLLNGVGLLI